MKLELTLFDKDGNPVTYSQDRVPGQKLLDYWEMMTDIEENIGQYSLPDIVGKKAEFVANLFDHKNVTGEAIITGLNAWNLIETIESIINKATGIEGDDPKLPELVQEVLENDSFPSLNN